MKSFQESAMSFRSKARLSAVKPSVLTGVCVLALAVILLLGQSLWTCLNGSNFEINKQEEDSALDSNTGTDIGLSQNSSAEKSSSSDVQESLVYVHVSGAVLHPGVYEIANNSRVQNALDKAGGFREDAATEAINLARIVVDGEHIVVPTLEEVASGTSLLLQESPSQSGLQGKININTASVSDLETLPGIGEVTAKSIVKERETNGAFSTPEDLMRVAGIGEKKYEALADLIGI